MAHMTFPAITVGLSVFLSVIYGLYWRTKKPVYLQMFRFWRRIFAVAFAIGVVTGIVITSQFGLNWSGFAGKVGPIVGPIIGMEVVTAFCVEAAFIGVVLSLRRRLTVSPRFHRWLLTITPLGILWCGAAGSSPRPAASRGWSTASCAPRTPTPT